jgi:acyl carrier protein
MAIGRDKVIKLFEDFFSKQLNKPFDENTKIQDVEGFDSLAMVDLSIEFDEAFNAELNLDDFKSATYLKDVVDEAVKRINN